MKKVFSILFSFLFLILPSTTMANGPSVVFNEVAWMGTTVSSNDEWIELYNNTKNNLNLEGWILKSEDGSPEIKLTGTIPASNFYLLERTDDNTVTEITADLIYKGSLSNNGENLKLYDNLNNVIDEIDCSAGWFSGDNATKKTMERINPFISGNQSANWQTSQSPGGTPKAKNPAPEQARYGAGSEQGTINNEQKTENLTENSSLPAPLKTKEYPSGIVINEILPSPEGPDDKEEWVELFNQNSFEVDLSGWKVKDVSGKITTFTLSKETKISSQGFLVIARPATKISLNNDGDGLRLLSPDGKIIDSVNYAKAPRGQSYSRTGSDWLWSVTLTPRAANITDKTETRPLQDNSASETKEKRELAAIGEPIRQAQGKQISKFLFVLLIALGLSIFSGIIILLLKKKLKKDRSIF